MKKVNKTTKASLQLIFCFLEVIVEPMRKYTVREITKQDSLTVAQLEPQKVPLLLEDKILPGRIQHIISNLSKHGKESEEACNKICEMLYKIDLDDDSSRKT